MYKVEWRWNKNQIGIDGYAWNMNRIGVDANAVYHFKDEDDDFILNTKEISVVSHF